MARIRVVKTHEDRCEEILAAAARLFYTRGYGTTSVKAITKEIGIARGTFYHCFSTKESLLQAIAERNATTLLHRIQAEVERRGGNAIDRLNAFYAASAEWKSAQRDTYVAMTRILHDGRNLLLRQRMTESTIRVLAPLLATYIRQGAREGLFRPVDSESLGEILLRLRASIDERALPLFHTLYEHPENLDTVASLFRLYQVSTERLLGVEPGTLSLVDEEELKRRFALAAP